jgi:hypothetical protein
LTSIRNLLFVLEGKKWESGRQPRNNKKRNEGPVKRLRDEWVNFQMVKFLAAQVEKNPSDEAEKDAWPTPRKKCLEWTTE